MIACGFGRKAVLINADSPARFRPSRPASPWCRRGHRPYRPWAGPISSPRWPDHGTETAILAVAGSAAARWRRVLRSRSDLLYDFEHEHRFDGERSLHIAVFCALYPAADLGVHDADQYGVLYDVDSGASSARRSGGIRIGPLPTTRGARPGPGAHGADRPGDFGTRRIPRPDQPSFAAC